MVFEPWAEVDRIDKRINDVNADLAALAELVLEEGLKPTYRDHLRGRVELRKRLLSERQAAARRAKDAEVAHE